MLIIPFKDLLSGVILLIWHWLKFGFIKISNFFQTSLKCFLRKLRFQFLEIFIFVFKISPKFLLNGFQVLLAKNFLKIQKQNNHQRILKRQIFICENYENAEHRNRKILLLRFCYPATDRGICPVKERGWQASAVQNRAWRRSPHSVFPFFDVKVMIFLKVGKSKDSSVAIIIGCLLGLLSHYHVSSQGTVSKYKFKQALLH